MRSLTYDGIPAIHLHAAMLPVRRLARGLMRRAHSGTRFGRRPRGLPDDPANGPFATGVREPRRPRPPFMPPRAAAVAPPMDPLG